MDYSDVDDYFRSWLSWATGVHLTQNDKNQDLYWHPTGIHVSDITHIFVYENELWPDIS